MNESESERKRAKKEAATVGDSNEVNIKRVQQMLFDLSVAHKHEKRKKNKT